MAIQYYFNQKFKWSTSDSVDEFGDHQHSAEKTIRGRLQLKKMNFESQSGESVLADAVLYTEMDYDIVVYDEIKYTDSTGKEKRFEVVDIYEAYGMANLHHKKVLLKYAVI